MKKELHPFNYTVITSLFCICLLITNLLGSKLFVLPGIGVAIPVTHLIYPLTFVLCDLVNEIYGSKSATQMVWLSFVLNFLVMCFVHLALILPGHPYWAVPNNPWGFSSVADYQNAFDSVFQLNKTIVCASIIAYLSGQFLDIYIYKKIKQFFPNRFMWLRNNLSTIFSQFVDTLIVFTIIFLYGLKMEWKQAFEVMLAIYAFKVFASIATTPLFYGALFIARPNIRSKVQGVG